MAVNPNGLGLAALRRLSSSGLLARVGLQKPFERLLFEGSKRGFQAAAAGSRAFKAARKLTAPERPGAPSKSGVFDLTPTDEQTMIRDSVRRFAEERLRTAASEADTACAAPDDLLAEANELGLALMSVPEALDGAGTEQSPVTGALIGEALAYGDMGLAVAALAPVGVANVLTRYADADQQARYLAAFAEDMPPAAALAVAEPQPLFDPMRLRTRAVRDGDDVLISGEKALVPRAAEAELLLVAAMDETDRPQVYVVERREPGIAVEAEPSMGVRAAGLGRLRMDRLRLPAGACLGGEQGCDYAELLALSRLAWCAAAVGTGQAVLDYVIPYVNERQAFGEPISHRQGVAFMVADMATELEGMRLATWRAAARAEQGQSCIRESALAHRLCARHGMSIGSAGVQLLGGHGFVKEHPVERWYRDLRAVAIMHGGLCL